MINVVCWNIAKKKDPWHCLAKMAEQEEADVAILQEAGHVPGNLIEKLEVDDKLFWHPMGFDRLPVGSHSGSAPWPLLLGKRRRV